MCHVRGVMQHTTKHDFLVSQRCICLYYLPICDLDLVQVRSSSTSETRVQGRGVISYPNPAQSDIFEISYKNHKTGKIRRWNLMESPFQEFPNGSYNQPGDVDSEVGSSVPARQNRGLTLDWLQVYNTHERERRQSNSDCQKKSLLHLAESLWALELERTSYLILLLIVLFSTQVSSPQLMSLKLLSSRCKFSISKFSITSQIRAAASAQYIIHFPRKPRKVLLAE